MFTITTIMKYTPYGEESISVIQKDTPMEVINYLADWIQSPCTISIYVADETGNNIFSFEVK